MSYKPIIGITTAHCSEEIKTFPRALYVESIRKVGGQPILLPPIQSQEDANAQLNIIDGLILTGGGDISPILLGEPPERGIGECLPERDISELLLTKEALKRMIPILGICRGIQVLAVAAGGKIYQDIYSQYPTNIEHKQKAPRDYVWHKVELMNSKLKKFIGRDNLSVNSIHHQAVSALPDDFQVNAVAEDGIIEGIERIGDHWCMGVQWHPEVLPADNPSHKIFMEFVKACYTKNSLGK